ncbi:Methyltransferase domain-containing protein [Sinosporangium album]|uniref:Methyltransferase domain-containing protein n=1 Tax=Sinosporangium album TaxID=504805 RepID=A0A1G7QKT8_9ACTN|nr:class I SAM-dependent methyltransferase [Sinosporangium album]SDF99133.1 Methyltransferase domain-containing protein [Sinosporangium album]
MVTPAAEAQGRTGRTEQTGRTDQRDVQYHYHRGLFPAMHDWERTERSIVEFTGENGPKGLLGLDQMGHFGPQGCDLVAAAVRDALPHATTHATTCAATRAAIDLCELGSGFGGALRYLTDALASGGVAVRTVYGVDLVPEHCEVSRRISAAQHRTNLTEICADAAHVPLPDASLDVVAVTGSMPHFPRPGAVLREAARLLRPGGTLVITEEVSLAPAGRRPSAAFHEVHPPDVFFTTPLPDRLRQLDEADFTDVSTRDLRDWAVALLRDRLKVVRVFRGSVAGIYGDKPVDLIERTLTTAREEYLAGRLLPMLVTARRAGPA